VTVIAYFVILGLAEGLWVVHIPVAKARLHLADGPLGGVLLAGPAALVLVMPLAGRLVDRFGSSGITRLAGTFIAFLPAVLSSARTLGVLLGGLLAFGVAGGLLVVALNAQAVQVELAYRRPLMASFHASGSLGGLTGAVTGGLLAWVRAGPVTGCLVVALPPAIVAAAAGRWRLAEPPQPGPRPVAGRGARQPGGEPETGSGHGSSRLVALGLLAICSLVCEGTAGNWSTVYLRDNLRTPAGLAVSGFAAFSVAMTVGRLVGDRLAARFGPVRLIRGCGLLAATSLAAGLASNDLVGAVAGFALFGAGMSCTVPQLFSAAGQAVPGHAGAAVARVAGFGYIGLVGGPVLIGACAALTGLPVALGIPVLLGLCVAAGARVFDPPLIGPGHAGWPWRHCGRRSH
jgi:MFS family permease